MVSSSQSVATASCATLMLLLLAAVAEIGAKPLAEGQVIVEKSVAVTVNEAAEPSAATAAEDQDSGASNFAVFFPRTPKNTSNVSKVHILIGI